jgi:hypothetical protein
VKVDMNVDKKFRKVQYQTIEIAEQWIWLNGFSNVGLARFGATDLLQRGVSNLPPHPCNGPKPEITALH